MHVHRLARPASAECLMRAAPSPQHQEEVHRLDRTSDMRAAGHGRELSTSSRTVLASRDSVVTTPSSVIYGRKATLPPRAAATPDSHSTSSVNPSALRRGAAATHGGAPATARWCRVVVSVPRRRDYRRRHGVIGEKSSVGALSVPRCPGGWSSSRPSLEGPWRRR
ncbi:unnamed protein product [Urochloa humidicola]